MAGHSSGWFKLRGKAKGSVFISRATMKSIGYQPATLKYEAKTGDSDKINAMLIRLADKSVQPGGQAKAAPKVAKAVTWDAASAALQAATAVARAKMESAIAAFTTVPAPADRKDFNAWRKANETIVDRADSLADIAEDADLDFRDEVNGLYDAWNGLNITHGYLKNQKISKAKAAARLKAHTAFHAQANALLTKMRAALLNDTSEVVKAEQAAAKAAGQTGLPGF